MEIFRKVSQFWGEVKLEMKKVTWPSKTQTINSTTVVLIATSILTLFLYLCDVGLARSMSWLIK